VEGQAYNCHVTIGSTAPVLSLASKRIENAFSAEVRI